MVKLNKGIATMILTSFFQNERRTEKLQSETVQIYELVAMKGEIKIILENDWLAHDNNYHLAIIDCTTKNAIRIVINPETLERI